MIKKLLYLPLSLSPSLPVCLSLYLSLSLSLLPLFSHLTHTLSLSLSLLTQLGAVFALAALWAFSGFCLTLDSQLLASTGIFFCISFHTRNSKFLTIQPRCLRPAIFWGDLGANSRLRLGRHPANLLCYLNVLFCVPACSNVSPNAFLSLVMLKHGTSCFDLGGTQVYSEKWGVGTKLDTSLKRIWRACLKATRVSESVSQRVPTCPNVSQRVPTCPNVSQRAPCDFF